MASIFFFQEKKTTLAERRRLRSFIDRLFQRKGKRLEALSYIFCSDQHLLEINRKFLNHDYYTDILTFNLSALPKTIEGEIYISVDRVRENAKNHKCTIREELHRVIFHGALHLCGYKDKSEKEKKSMTAAENECLRRYLK